MKAFLPHGKLLSALIQVPSVVVDCVEADGTLDARRPLSTESSHPNQPVGCRACRKPSIEPPRVVTIQNREHVDSYLPARAGSDRVVVREDVFGMIPELGLEGWVGAKAGCGGCISSSLAMGVGAGDGDAGRLIGGPERARRKLVEEKDA